jgi:hypothetical protein
MRPFLRALLLTFLLFNCGVAFEAARAGDGFVRSMEQQARLRAEARKQNTMRPAAKKATPMRQPASPKTGQKPTVGGLASTPTKPASR